MYGLTLVFMTFASQAATQNTFTVPNWSGNFAANSGVLESLKPANDTSFDFSPSDFFAIRNGVGNYHTGDFSLRWRQQGKGEWSSFDTAQLRDTNPLSSMTQESLLHSDFANVFSASDSGKLSIQRDWLQVDSDLALQVSLSVPANATTIEIGSFGFPIEFNSIFSNRTADEVTAKCSLIDPYIGQSAGYVQVTRLTGTGPNLVITPYGNQSKFEGWRFLTEPNSAPLYYQSTIFEGFYSWEMFTKAYAQQEWNTTEPWNIATSVTLKPGESIKLGLRFTPAQNLHDIESTVASVGKPVAIGLPGYVLPHDVNGQLFLLHNSAVTSITVSPTGALTFTPSSIPSNTWKSFAVDVNESAFGRVLVTVQYADGLHQTIHYFVTQSQPATASSLADFAFEKAYLNDESDPFNRYGLVTFDSIANAQVLQDPRVWIAGIADEAGSFYEALSAKESALPDPAHILQLEKMVNISVWGHLQNSDYSVKRSLFFYEPDAVPGYNYSPQISWGGSWNEADAHSTWRAYDYVHVSSIYYSLYRAERVSPGILTVESASWYLQQAYKTVVASQKNTAYADVGLMGETMWARLVTDLQNEGFSDASQQILDIMQGRQKLWASQSNPFGSEMAWDSTGQEGVYVWSRFFNDTTTIEKTLNSIRGYMPTVPHWGWNGNARRYWDFLYGGKLTRIERMIHHYGSSLNALPLLDNYKHLQDPASPAAFYDLRVGYAGNMGPLSNINAAGIPSTAFHSWPDTMAWDGYTGDYGPTYLGHILGSCTYLVQHPEFGWVAMGGNINSTDPVTVKPVDTVQRCLYVADMGLLVEFDTGQIDSFTYAPTDKRLTVNVVKSTMKAGTAASNAIMTYQSTLGRNVELLTKGLEKSKGGNLVRLPGSISFQS